MSWFALFVVVIVSPAAAHAMLVNGNRLYELLQAGKRCESSRNNSDCANGRAGLFYVEGVVDSLNTITNHPAGNGFCVPTGVSGGQLQDVTLQFLDGSPESRHFPAAWIVALALSQNFHAQNDTRCRSRRNIGHKQEGRYGKKRGSPWQRVKNTPHLWRRI